MNPTRLKILLGITAVLLLAFLWNWISGWGLVTIEMRDAPISKVIRSIERQGGVAIVSNLDPETTVSMNVHRVPVSEAIDVLAAQTDGNWSLVYIAGPTKADLINGKATLGTRGRDEQFRTFRSGGGGGMMAAAFDTAPDPRKLTWNVSPADPAELQAYFNQFSQKTGSTVVAPRDWNPTLAQLPSSGAASSAVRKLARSNGGQVEEIFLVSAGNRGADDDRPRRADGQRPDLAASGGTPAEGTPRRDGGPGREMNPEWMRERALAMIEQLPKEQREEARKEFDEMRAFFQEIRDLPPEQRRAKMEERMSDPLVQEKMEERRSAREDKRSPESRANRFRRYVERKQALKSS